MDNGSSQLLCFTAWLIRNIILSPAMVPKAFASVLARKIFHTDLLGRPSVEQKALEHLAKDAAIAPYIEEEPSIRQWLWNSLKPTRQGCVQYISNLFPFTRWMARYNVHWMMNDAIAGRIHRPSHWLRCLF